MSRERARRRAEREREAAIRTAARAAEAERTERWAARRRALTAWVPRRPSRPSGILEQRRRRQWWTTLVLLLVVNVAVWVLGGGVGLQLLVAAVSPLAAPVLHTLLFRR